MKKYLPQLFICSFLLYFLWLIHPAFLGRLSGTFKQHRLSNNYQQLANFLERDKTFSRTLWIPSVDKFGFFSLNHPAVAGYDYFQVASLSGVLSNFNNQNVKTSLQNAAIKYVILPEDSERTIFLKDNVYNESLYNKSSRVLQQTHWLKKVAQFGKINVYQIPNFKDHFWIANDPSARIVYRQINQTSYTVFLKNVKQGDLLIFSESYNPYWQISLQNHNISSKPFDSRLNGFYLPMTGSYTLMLSYTPQKWVTIGLWISAFTLFITFFTLILYYFKKGFLR